MTCTAYLRKCSTRNSTLILCESSTNTFTQLLCFVYIDQCALLSRKSICGDSSSRTRGFLKTTISVDWCSDKNNTLVKISKVIILCIEKNHGIGVFYLLTLCLKLYYTPLCNTSKVTWSRHNGHLTLSNIDISHNSGILDVGDWFYRSVMSLLWLTWIVSFWSAERWNSKRKMQNPFINLGIRIFWIISHM